MSISIHDRNIAFGNFVQTCLGTVSRNVRRIDFAMDDVDRFRFRFVLREESPEDRDAIQNTLDDFEALQAFPVHFTTEIIVSATAQIHPDRNAGYLGVYCEKL